MSEVLSDEWRRKLIDTAIEVRKLAYAPYSNYAVGAALLTASGNIYKGVNVENAAYPSTICAERAAVYNAVSAGERSFIAIAVATSNSGSPCGTCRQVLSEFGLDVRVILTDINGNLVEETTLDELLPGAFRAEQLSDN
jgi:cytidine deaminase